MGAKNLPPFTEFRINSRIRANVAEFKREKQEQARNGGGVASPQQRRELLQEQEERAKTREAMKEADKRAPSPEGQLDRLREKERREPEQPPNMNEV